MIRSSRLAWTHELSIGSSNFGHLLVSRAPETPFFPNDFLQRWWSRSWSLQKNQQQVMLSRLICALQGSGTKRWRITGNLQLKGVGERLAESVASNSASCFKAGVFIEKPGIWGFIFSTCWKFCEILQNCAQFCISERGARRRKLWRPRKMRSKMRPMAQVVTLWSSERRLQDFKL
jgi:hypothetical protein